MSARRLSVPTYRLHKSSGQAIVTLPDGVGGRHDVLLGKFRSPESRAEYARVIAEWETAGRRLVAAVRCSSISINELLLAFWKHAKRHYRRPDGTATNEQNEYRLALKSVKSLYGVHTVSEFGPLALKAVRQSMIDADLSLGVINQRIGRIKRVFKWGVAEELVPPHIHHGLQAVAGLPRHRGLARETLPIGPVPEAFVDAALPYLTPTVRAMVELQRVTGMRPGEVCMMRACDIDMSGAIWIYQPPIHKLAWRGSKRSIPLGPRARAIVREFLSTKTEAYLFSPARSVETCRVVRRLHRNTKTYPCEALRVDRKKSQGGGGRKPGERYSTSIYGAAIARACSKADAVARESAVQAAKANGTEIPNKKRIFVPHWHPNQLRHNLATAIRRNYGLEGAQVVLGHARADVTQIYAERNLMLAERIAAECG